MPQFQGLVLFTGHYELEAKHNLRSGNPSIDFYTKCLCQSKVHSQEKKTLDASLQYILPLGKGGLNWAKAVLQSGILATVNKHWDIKMLQGLRVKTMLQIIGVDGEVRRRLEALIGSYVIPISYYKITQILGKLRAL